MKRRIIVTLILTATLLFSMNMYSYAGEWKQGEKGWWYELEDGSYVKGEIRQIDNDKYLFGIDGYMQVGWQQYNNKWYYADKNGKLAVGWKDIGEKQYYMNADGFMETGFITIGTKDYYLDTDGCMKKGSFEVDGTWYITDDRGVIQKNKVEKGTADSGIKFKTGKDGAVFRYNEADMDWEYLPGKEESAELMMEKLFDDYKTYGNTELFGQAARENLKGLLSEEDIEVFIDAMEHEYMFNIEDDPYEAYEEEYYDYDYDYDYD